MGADYSDREERIDFISTYVSNRDGGATDEQGHYRFQVKVWDGNIENGMVVTQNSPLGMSVLVGTGDLKIDYSNYAYTAWNDANSSVTTADGSNPRIDRIVAYIDRGMTPTVSPPNNQGMLKFMAVAGTPNAVPTRPSDATVNSAVGASNPWCDLANVLVGTGVTTIVNSNITDTRQPISLSISADDGGWLPSIYTPNTITANGNRSYDLVFNSTDLTDTISPGMRIKTTRTTTAPTNAFSLDGTNDYYNDTTVSGMTFTDDFVAGAWVYMTAYPTGSDVAIISRFNGNGWSLRIRQNGQLRLVGYNTNSANFRLVDSYQSIPLNRWVHIAAQLDMSAHTYSSTQSYIMIDGVYVPGLVVQGGSNPSSLIQGGNLEIGSENGGTAPFPGYIDQAFVTSAKMTQANVKVIMNQAWTSALCTTHSVVSAYSNGSTTDINTTNANNLTAQNGATTVAKSPFATNGFGTSTGTTDYGIVQKAVFSTNTTLTVQVPEGCTIPTSGGVSAVAYSTQKSPFGFVGDKGRWYIVCLNKTFNQQASPVVDTWYNTGGLILHLPAGNWSTSYTAQIHVDRAAGGYASIVSTLSTSASSETDARFSIRSDGANVTVVGPSQSVRGEITTTALTGYYLLIKTATTPMTNIYTLGERGLLQIVGEPSLL